MTMTIPQMLGVLVVLVAFLIIVCVVAIVADKARHAHRFYSRHEERRRNDRR